jgi:hypothetical protein
VTRFWRDDTAIADLSRALLLSNPVRANRVPSQEERVEPRKRTASAVRADDDADTIDADRGRNGGKTRKFEENLTPNDSGHHTSDEKSYCSITAANNARNSDLVDLATGWSSIVLNVPGYSLA